MVTTEERKGTVDWLLFLNIPVEQTGGLLSITTESLGLELYHGVYPSIFQ